ncbi:signal transduction histidine kinase [Mitsuaria sp. BK041]|nr:hypothetical protein [Mitsuaria sp. BK041]MBB3293545.1 signal transduction histidine kinase [Mitsuaria sp. BK041]
MPLPIRSRLLVLVLSVMLPGIIAALWVSWRTWSDEQEATVRHMRDSTRALSMVVDKELARRAGIARVLSLSQILDSAPQVPQDDLAMLELQSRRAMQGLSGWVELNAPGRTLFSTRLASGRVPDTPLAPAAAASAPGLAVTGPAAVAAAPAPLELPTTAASRPVLVREAVPLIEQAVIGDLGPDPATGQLRAQIVQPIERGGHVWLNMSISVLPQEMQQIIDAQRLPPDWTATIMDGRGTVVARHPGGISYAGRPGTDDLRRLMATREEARFDSVNLDGKPVVGYFTKSPQGWTVVTAVPRDSGMGGLGGRTALQPIAIGALLLVLVGMFGALWISRRISGPIHALSAIASELRAGEPVRAPKTGMLECDEVALALADASVAIRQGRSELEDRVNEAIDRTREAEQLSSRSQRTAALGRLTGGVAHDFNNLLGVISNSAHLIQRSPHAESLAMPLGAIMRSVDVGSRLTQHLLRVAGRQPVHPQVVDLRSTLGEMNELLATVLGKRMQLTMTMAPDLPSVRVDPSELELALINIALNARDATNGMGEITLEAGRAGRRPGPGARGVRRHQRLRPGARHSRGPAGARLRALLHHQAGRQGDRPGPEPGAGFLRAGRWHRAHRQPTGCRHDGDPAAAGAQQRVRRRRRCPRRGGAAGGARQCAGRRAGTAGRGQRGAQPRHRQSAAQLLVPGADGQGRRRGAAAVRQRRGGGRRAVGRGDARLDGRPGAGARAAQAPAGSAGGADQRLQRGAHRRVLLHRAAQAGLAVADPGGAAARDGPAHGYVTC